MPRNSEGRQNKKRTSSARVDSLDGLRAFAIISVMLYHMSVSWLPSGHMGVVIFLVLAGYLASSIVLRTMRREGSISLIHVWLHRITRVWPAMATMIVFTVALCVVFNHVLLTKLKPDLLPSLLLSNNLGAIFRGASYFDKLGGVSPLTHLWYLGVDIQFFIPWTIVVTMLCPRGRSKRICRRVALVLALVSAVLMAVLYDPNADPTRVYYGPDTRAFAPLLGAWLGLAWPLGGRPIRLDRAHHTVRSLPLYILSPLSLVALVVIMVVVPDTSPFLYRGGMLLVSILTVLLMAGLLDRNSPISRVFSLKPLVWLGTRSYGLYLWHFPLFQLFKVTNNATSPVMVVLAIVLSFVAAEFSLRLVERRISHNLLPFIVNDDMVYEGGVPRVLALIPAALVVISLAVGITGLVVVPDTAALPEDAINNTGAGAAEAMDLSDRTSSKEDADASSTDSSSSTSSSKEDDSASSKSSSTDDQKKEDQKSTSKDKDKDKDDEKDTKQDLDNLPTGTITLEASSKTTKEGLYTPVIIADSVAGDADWCFSKHIPDGLLDSYVGRRPDQALSVLQGYLEQGVVGNIVVLDSFSNIPATDDTMRELIESCGDRHVYLVNVRIPEVEQAQINEQIERFAAKYDNVTLIDWYSYSEGHDDWIYPDGEHLTPEGQPYYVDMITNAIAKDFAADGGTVTEG